MPGFKPHAIAVALALSGAAAASGLHSSFGYQNRRIHFMKNIAMAGDLLQVVAFGGGTFTVDGWRSARQLAKTR